MVHEVIDFSEKNDTLEAFFKRHLDKGIIDYAVRAENRGGEIRFYIHPAREAGETPRFSVLKNTLGIITSRETENCPDCK